MWLALLMDLTIMRPTFCSFLSISMVYPRFVWPTDCHRIHSTIVCDSEIRSCPETEAFVLAPHSRWNSYCDDDPWACPLSAIVATVRCCYCYSVDSIGHPCCHRHDSADALTLDYRSSNRRPAVDYQSVAEVLDLEHSFCYWQTHCLRLHCSHCLFLRQHPTDPLESCCAALVRCHQPEQLHLAAALWSIDFVIAPNCVMQTISK